MSGNFSYNDYVVSEVMKLFKDEEACVIYLPDHGLDLYVSDPTFAGHGRTVDPVSCEVSTSIPMMVYCTEMFKQNFPEKVDYLEQVKKEYYNSGDLPETVMKLSNIALLKGGEDN